MTTATMTPMMTLLLRTIRATMASLTAAVTAVMMTAMMTGEGMKRCVGVSLLYSDFSYQRTISKALWLILVPPLALQLAVNTDGPGHYLASKNELSSPGWPDFLTCKGCPCVFVLFSFCLLANLVQKMSANRLKKGWSILCGFVVCMPCSPAAAAAPWERESPAKPVPSPRLGGRSNSACLNNHADEPPTDLFIMHAPSFRLLHILHTIDMKRTLCVSFRSTTPFPCSQTKKQCCLSCLWSCSAPCLDLTFVFSIDTYLLFDALVFCINTKLPCYCNLCLAWDLFLIALLDAACSRWKGRIMTAVSSTSFSFLLLFPVRNTFCFDYTGSSLSSTSSTSLLFCPCVTFCDDQYNHTGWWQPYYLLSSKSFLSLICF